LSVSEAAGDFVVGFDPFFLSAYFPKLVAFVVERLGDGFPKFGILSAVAQSVVVGCERRIALVQL